MDTKENIKEEKSEKKKNTKKTSSNNSKKITTTAKKTNKKITVQDKKEETKKSTTKKATPKKNTAVKKENKTSKSNNKVEKKSNTKKTNNKTYEATAKLENKKLNKTKNIDIKSKEKSGSKKSTSAKRDTKKDNKITSKKEKKENTNSKEEKIKKVTPTTKQANKKNTKKNDVKEKANNKTTTRETKNINKKINQKEENIIFKKIKLLYKKSKDKFFSKKQENANKIDNNPEKKKNLIVTISLFIVFFIILCISSYNIYKWYDSFKRTEKQINDVQGMVEIIEKEDSENTVIIEQEQEINLENPYWNFISMNLIDVNFTKLKEINSQTIGWIKVPGTNVNYPFVQTDNNDFYLYHSFDQSYNDAGWVFMDYRNSLTEMNKNTILYAHGRYDNTMFGSLRHIHNNGWLNDSNNFVIMLSTDYENTLWQVFSTYTIPTTNDYIKSEFATDEEFINFVNMIKGRSIYDFNTPVTTSDNILTLSTCYDDYSKMVIHAKLIKKEAKQ